MNRKRKNSGLMSLILLLAMLDGAFFPQILRLMPDTENSWQLSAALLRVTMQDCRPESEHAQVLRGAAGSENGTEIVTVRLRLLFDLLLPCTFLTILWPLFCMARERKEHAARKKLRWFLAGSRNYYCLAYCEEHGWLKGKIRLKKSETNPEQVFCVKTLKLVDEEKAQEIMNKKAQIREKERLREQNHSA